MKKLSILALTIVLAFAVSGCAMTGNKVQSKTCTMKANGIDQTFVISATNKDVDKMEIKMVFDNSLFGVNTLSTLTDAQKTTVKETMLKNLGLESDTDDGLEIIVDINDQMTITVKIDITKADPKILQKITGMDTTNVDWSFKRTISDMEKSGATCK